MCSVSALSSFCFEHHNSHVTNIRDRGWGKVNWCFCIEYSFYMYVPKDLFTVQNTSAHKIKLSLSFVCVCAVFPKVNTKPYNKIVQKFGDCYHGESDEQR